MAMQTVSAYQNYQTDFSITTSSGDTISMALFQEQEAGAATDGEGAAFSFRQMTGFDFQYTGNGIDEKDMEEIAAAMEKMRPKLQEFMAKIGGDMPQPVTPLAREILAMIPQPETPEENTYLKDQIVTAFDDVAAEAAGTDETVLESMKRLLEEIFAQLERPDQILYA